MLTEASGLLGIVIVRIGGPKPSEEIIQLLFRWGCELMALGEPMPCIACGTGALYPSAEKSPAGWLIVIPARADFTRVSVGAICRPCMDRHDDDGLCELAGRQFDGRVIPTADIHHSAGRA